MSLSDKVFGNPGYSTDVKLSSYDLATLRFFVDYQFAGVVARNGFDPIAISHYHTLTTDHHAMWAKEKNNRILPAHTVESVKNTLSFMDTLRAAFGNYRLSQTKWRDAEHDGKEEIHWRIVRPNELNDVAPMHRDYDYLFNAAGERAFAEGVKTVKVWIPLYCDPGCGLLVIPNSHLHDGEVCESYGVPIDSEPGDTVIFNERLLHRGRVNLGNHTRVSMEITLVLG